MRENRIRNTIALSMALVIFFLIALIVLHTYFILDKKGKFLSTMLVTQAKVMYIGHLIKNAYVELQLQLLFSVYFKRFIC